MSNIDKQALREAAELFNSEEGDHWWDEEQLTHEDGLGLNEADGKFIATANPATVLALLDELEAKDNRINRLEAIVAVAEQRNALMREWKRALKVPCDLVDDQVPVVIHGMVIRLERLKETEDKLTAAERRIAELEARRAPDSFNIIGENIRTQDNRITSEPMFCVFQKREIVVDEDYDCDRIVWVDEEGCEATERKRMRLELLHDNCRETPDKWRRIAVKDIDDFVTCCFTEQGCKDYLACNGHNLRLPFIYVKSGFRNAEYIGIRNWLAGIGKGE
ncbi:ead/Ea22-like family protein [Enterobacter hormaechei]|nr:ead/Ea22-like family protein [Enterobacter hormaechei]ELT5713267.1 ead/Ea22-like family protein [Enterobacter hormaechei]